MRSFRVVIVIAFILTSIVAIPTIGAPVAREPSRSVTIPDTPTLSGSPGTIKDPVENATVHLAINESRINTTTIDTITLGAGGVVRIGSQKIINEFNTRTFDIAIRNASNKQAVITAALNWAANRTAQLRARQTAAIEAYNNDELSTQAFLRELAIIAEKAGQLRNYIETVDLSRMDVSKDIKDRATYLELELNTLTGPVRSRIQSALQGTPSTPQRFFVRTSAHGMVITTIDDGMYIRETYLTGARTIPNSTGFTDVGQASNYMKELYPIAHNWSGFNSFSERGLYKFKFYDYPWRITAYLYKSSGKIFYEEQVLDIDVSNTVNGSSNLSDRYALTTNVTYPGGYMLIRLTHRSNGADRNGTISINNKTIGVTGDDGELYILQPAKLTTINATINGETLSVTVGQTTQAPPIHPQPAPDFNSLSEPELWAKAEDPRG